MDHVLAALPADRQWSLVNSEATTRAVVAVHEGMLAQELVELGDASLPLLHRRLVLATLAVLDG